MINVKHKFIYIALFLVLLIPVRINAASCPAPGDVTSAEIISYYNTKESHNFLADVNTQKEILEIIDKFNDKLYIRYVPKNGETNDGTKLKTNYDADQFLTRSSNGKYYISDIDSQSTFKLEFYTKQSSNNECVNGLVATMDITSPDITKLNVVNPAKLDPAKYGCDIVLNYSPPVVVSSSTITTPGTSTTTTTKVTGYKQYCNYKQLKVSIDGTGRLIYPDVAGAEDHFYYKVKTAIESNNKGQISKYITCPNDYKDFSASIKYGGTAKTYDYTANQTVLEDGNVKRDIIDYLARDMRCADDEFKVGNQCLTCKIKSDQISSTIGSYLLELYNNLFLRDGIMGTYDSHSNKCKLCHIGTYNSQTGKCEVTKRIAQTASMEEIDELFKNYEEKNGLTRSEKRCNSGWESRGNATWKSCDYKYNPIKTYDPIAKTRDTVIEEGYCYYCPQKTDVVIESSTYQTLRITARSVTEATNKLMDDGFTNVNCSKVENEAYRYECSAIAKKEECANCPSGYTYSAIQKKCIKDVTVSADSGTSSQAKIAALLKEQFPNEPYTEFSCDYVSTLSQTINHESQYSNNMYGCTLKLPPNCGGSFNSSTPGTSITVVSSDFEVLKKKISPDCYADTIPYETAVNLRERIETALDALPTLCANGACTEQPIPANSNYCDAPTTVPKTERITSPNGYWIATCQDTYTSSGDKPKLVGAGSGFTYNAYFSLQKVCTIAFTGPVAIAKEQCEETEEYDCNCSKYYWTENGVVHEETTNCDTCTRDLPSGCSWTAASDYEGGLKARTSDLNNLIKNVQYSIKAGTYTYQITDTSLKDSRGRNYIYTVSSDSDPSVKVETKQNKYNTTTDSKIIGDGRKLARGFQTQSWQNFNIVFSATTSLPYASINKTTGQVVYSTDQDSSQRFAINSSSSNMSTVSESDKEYYYRDGRKYYTSIDSPNFNVYSYDKKIYLKSVNDATKNIVVTAKDVNDNSPVGVKFDSGIQCYYGVYNRLKTPDPGEPDDDFEETPYNVIPNNSCDVTRSSSDCDGLWWIWRPIDLKDVFPNNRSARFNWSGNAYMSKSEPKNIYKSTGANISPVTLTKTIESKGNDIYTDDREVDYEFDLTKENIEYIREYNKQIDDINRDGYKNYLDYDMNCVTVSNDREVCLSRFLDNEYGNFINYSSNRNRQMGRDIAVCNNAINGHECDISY